MASHVVADQGEAIAFLGSRGAFVDGVAATRVETHGAIVFLAGRDVYKMKRAVRFPYMDFSTLDLRRRASEREIEINRDNAPGVYLGVVPLTREADGLRLGGAGEAVEWLVHMRRFDDGAALDRLSERGGLSRDIADALAEAVLQAHERAPRRDFDAARALEDIVAENGKSLLEHPALFPAAAVEVLTSASRRKLASLRGLLQSRQAAGFVRRCHGDLHLGNIVLIGGKPTLFDALEFSESLATCDVLYDFAFLLMDLWRRGLRDVAGAALNAYLALADDAEIEGLAAMPLFMSVRAAIRAKVAAAGAAMGGGDAVAEERTARRYFALAEACLRPPAPRLVAVGGLSGSGKSSVAARIAPLFGGPPGAVLARSDVERKRLFGKLPSERLPEAAYASDVTERVYAATRDKAARVLRTGLCAVADAVHANVREREAIEAVAAREGVPFVGLWLAAPAKTRIDRVEGRSGDASDATAATALSQEAYDIGPMSWRVVDASDPLEAVARRAAEVLGVHD
jgi:aminoglycoside phosphotransferase family enzyme/predicted kinase